MGTSRFMLVLTIIIGIITTFLIVKYVSGGKIAVPGESMTMTKVVAAAKKIPQGTRITKDMLKTIDIPAKYVHPSAATDLNNVVNLFAQVEFVPEEVILTEKLFSDKTGTELRFKIPDGFRAVSIAINPPSGIGGHVKPGNTVDVLWTYRNLAKSEESKVVTLFQKVLVLAVGGEVQKKEGALIADTITLALKPEDAQVLTLSEAVGKLKLTLRPVTEENDSLLSVLNFKLLQSMFP